MTPASAASPPEFSRSGPSAVRLERLLKALPGARLEGAGTVEISSISCDSRTVQPGALFAALPGAQTDGALFAEDALRRGAVAILAGRSARLPRGTCALRVERVREAMADLSAELYAHPSRRIRVMGITGTNGKTTTSFMVRDILQAAGLAAGRIGTIQYDLGSRRLPAVRTTPEAPDLQRMLAECARAGVGAVALEVSSQGLAAERLRGTRFAAAVFTNLTEEHLDFHGTMEAYFQAKKSLFEALAAESAAAPAIVNLDDPYGRRLAAEPFLAGRVVTFGRDDDAAVRAREISITGTTTSFLAHTPWGSVPVELPLPGRFQIDNALAAIAVCGALGISPDCMAKALARMPPVPGRLERIPDPQHGRWLFVDYAHTEDALRLVLQTLREISPGRLLCVFGCGGDRDPAKRPRMGAAVSALADLAVVTSDNPRSEDPAAIIRQILAGMDPATPCTVEPDRAAAIRLALDQARPGDTVLVAGKGHETYQEAGGRRIYFNDREWLARLAAGA